MAKEGLVKIVARNAGSLGAKAVDQPQLAQRATQIISTATQSFEKRAASVVATTQAVEDTSKNYSGLSPVEVVLILAVVLGLFVVLLIIGELCKVFNKPRKEAAPYTQQKLFQPSAAGYGTRAATNNLKVPNGGGKGMGSRLSLLQFASPMGTGGRVGDDTIDTSVSSHNSGQGDYFGRKSNGHTRGQSSGVQLPGAATMASSRKGPGAHPMLNGNSTFAPDGSGFTPGQPVNFAGYAGPNSPSSPERTTPMVPGQGNVPSHARVGMGRPPAADAKRKSRYSRAMSKRIDSMGPGQLRKSLYAGADDDPMNHDLYGAVGNRKSKMIRKPSTEDRSPEEIQASGGAGLRRIDSMGKGDARRRSQIQSVYRSSRAISVYNSKNNDKAIFLSAQADNFGAGRIDPLGARSANGPTSPGVNGNLMLPNQQGRLRSGSGSSSAGQSYGQRTPGSSSEPLVQQSPNNTQYSYSSQQQQSYDNGYPMAGNQSVGGGFKPGSIMPSGGNAPIGYSQPMMQQQSQQSMAAYPGGGAPRVRPRQMAM
ncbi:uncharacterized protein FA14DRAFT_170253 [Meira miltonrushii]|uniref:Uncharacterized protein n=1 Tax=Meira miltonrushii TaxID=1280837 RepID=A0A316VMS0_9BASI|nr:uncharacterized protein FA14DRAFT_170253 [Meira miltonrushii]PWN37401.1 hypothetical protein FA14DRAFT_170253 [Meira miltonrushii]